MISLTVGCGFSPAFYDLRKLAWLKPQPTYLIKVYTSTRLRTEFTMSNYIRDKTKGGCYFLTFNLANRHSQLLLTHIDNFRDAYAKTIQHHRFDLAAMVMLPDHVHMLVTLPSDSDDYAVIVASIKSQFSRQINKTEIITPSRQAKRERGIWQRRFWEHRIRNDLDYQQHMDYIHYNPVKHGYVTNPQDWHYSTLHKLIEKGVYPADWGMDESDKNINIQYDR